MPLTIKNRSQNHHPDPSRPALLLCLALSVAIACNRTAAQRNPDTDGPQVAPTAADIINVAELVEEDLPDPSPPATEVVHSEHGDHEVVAGEVMVQRPSDVSEGQFTLAVEALGAKRLDANAPLSKDLGLERVQVPAGMSVQDAVELMEKSGIAERAEPDYILQLENTPDDPQWTELWGLRQIQAPMAWDEATGSSDVVVAVVDSGIDFEHPDLQGNLYVNPGEVPHNGKDDDGDGFVDNVSGWDFVSSDANPTDSEGHGTHVAGTIGARGNNATGVAGVNWRVSILPLRVCAAWGCRTSDVTEAMLYASKAGARVINMSLGGQHPALSYQERALERLQTAGTLVVAAAGNNGSDNDTSPTYPASYESDNVIAVAATDPFDNLAAFSNYGKHSVDLAAPGVGIISTYPPGGYRELSGTSMAAPHVAGAAALFLSTDPNASVLEVRTRLLQTVTRVTTLVGKVSYDGRLNLHTALTQETDCDANQGLACDCSPDEAGNVNCVTDSGCELGACDENATCTETEVGFGCSCHDGFTGDGFDCQDVNECSLGVADCAANARCVNTPGDYACECLPGFTGDGQSCEDIDECAMGTHQCPSDGECANTRGSYECSCPEGFLSEGPSCADVDECSEGLHSCDENATCLNTLGSYSCLCDRGYAGDGFFCFRVSECEPGADQCNENASCTDVGWGYACLCGDGWRGDGSSCDDVDECAEGLDDCNPNADCENTIGGYSCTCHDGYQGDGKACVDVDECARGEGSCGPNAHCENQEGGFECVCDAGYSGDGATCTDEDECENQTDNCSVAATCVNNDGGFDCQCLEGFEGDGISCFDVNECVRGLFTCHELAQCVNTPGTYHCACQAGYEGDGVSSCVDIDECSQGTDQCSEWAECENTLGGYDCTCLPGFEGDGKTCTDLDECANGVAQCDPNASCVNTPGNYQCECNEGFEGGGFTCDDIDECGRGWEHCGEGGNCKNTPGSYQCICKPGFRGNGGGKCDDVDECAEGTHSCHPAADCENTVAGYDCVCQEGYVGDGFQCDDVDECATGMALCSTHADCVNTEPGYDCVCRDDYEGNGLTCKQIDECAEGNTNCSSDARCIDLDGGYRCECNQGFEGDGITCQDINECSNGTAQCDPNADCANTAGGYECECREPYTGNGKHCVSPGDTDECANGSHDCDINATCTNIEGSYLCECKTGYEGSGQICTEIDECSTGEDDCDEHATCTNTPGSYACTCLPGFEGNGTRCREPFINECEESNPCSEHASCRDTDGSYECTCNAGFEGDGVECTDIDECQVGSDNCSELATCINTAPGFECQCPAGFDGDGTQCTLDECAAGLDHCDPHAICRDEFEGYSCECEAGYSGDGTQCLDVDECAAETHDCDSNARCTNTEGSYECTCNAGYEGSGRTCLLPPSHPVALASLGDHTCALLDNGGIRCWGRNTYGQLGLGSTQNIGDNEPADGADYADVGGLAVAVTAGVAHSCALLDSGDVRCWGKNSFGQLGLGHTDTVGDNEYPSAEPVVNVGGEVTQVVAGGEHTCALLTDGNVRCWGLGINGQLGYGETAAIGDDEAPAQAGDVALGAPAQQIVAGRDHTCALLTDGRVRCWGRGQWGALGYGSTEDIGDDETPAQAGDVDVGGVVVQLSAGWYHTCALTNNGEVRCWGYGMVGQLGLSDTETIGDDEIPSGVDEIELGGNAVHIASGLYHNCALLDGGSVRCWGYGDSGRLGYANSENIGDDEHPIAAGEVDVGEPVTDLAVGAAHTCAILHSGLVRCWGDGSFGQLGGGSTRDIGDNETPAGTSAVLASVVNECLTGDHECSEHATCVDIPDGYLCECDQGWYGDGVDCEDVDECADVSAPCDSNAFCENVPGSYLCACRPGYNGDGLFCSDRDECVDGQYCDENAVCSRLGDEPYCECGIGYQGNGVNCVASGTYVAEVQAGYTHTCARLSDGNVRCWGAGVNGQLGYANSNTIGDNELPSAVGNVDVGGAVSALSLGGRHTCALMSDSAVRCWGQNNYGQLGYGHKRSIGDDETPASTGNVNVGGSVVQIATGESHSCALLADGAVRCWGAGATGRLGYGSNDNVGDQDAPANAGNVELAGPAEYVAAGAYHTCAILEDGNVSCWGYGAYGQLGLASTATIGDNELPSSQPVLDFQHRAVRIALGQHHSCALLETGEVYCWGQGRYGALGYGALDNIGDDESPLSAGAVDLGSQALDLAAGLNHTCALLDTHVIRCWGNAQQGELGAGNTKAIGDNELPSWAEPVPLGAAAHGLSSAGQHVCALLSSGVACWGANGYGQLGYGHSQTLGDDELPSEAGVVTILGD